VEKEEPEAEEEDRAQQVYKAHQESLEKEVV